MEKKQRKTTKSKTNPKSKISQIKEKKYRAVFTEKKEYRRKLKLNEINNLNMIVVVVPREKGDKVVEYIENNGGVIISKNRAKGISRASIFSGIGMNEVQVSVIFSMARSEDAEKLIFKTSEKFRLDIPGNGKAFMIDVLGYMGAKAPFIEKR